VTDAQQLRHLRDGPPSGALPGGLGLLTVDAPSPAPAQVAGRVRAALAAHLRGEVMDPDLDFDLDWGIWSLGHTDSGLVLELAITGFPVSGFSGLRRFLLRHGARTVTQRSSR